MLRHDVSLYRSLLRRLSLQDLMILYERTVPDYETLAGIIAEELCRRLDGSAEPIA